ncbi:MAG: hypothetical protein IT385_12755 [Deltaproteobacteria bacterium]|nr:hypothetical protein [Deltaproteobacteria bacterium]
MKFKATLRIHTTGDIVQRNPNFWDKFKKAFGGKPNLDTDRVKTKLQATELVMGAKRALERLGVDDAIALMVDSQVLFEDKHGRPGDASDLFTSFFENEDVYGREFEQLRLAVEHRDAGLHYVIEIVASGVHDKSKATALVHIGGRVMDLEPRVGEDAEAFRARVMPLLATPALAETSRLQFETFAARVDEALKAALAGVRVTMDDPKPQVERPGKGRGQPQQPQPDDPRYDPYGRYHPSPLGDIATMLFWTSMMSWAWHPHYVVIDQSGNEVGSTENLDAASGGDGTSDGGGMDDPGGPDGGDIDAGDGGDFDAGGDFDFGGDW